MLTSEMRSFIEKAEQKALATNGEDGLNVVPLSAAHIIDEKIVLCDFFMSKTARNTATTAPAALACWSGFTGIQVKGLLSYEKDGERFEQIAEWARNKYPDRTLSGVLVLSPESVFDLTPGNAGKKLA